MCMQVLAAPGPRLEVHTRNLQTFHRVQVLTGARIPTDGLVEDGSSYVDESMLTGESEPVCKMEGAAVIGGTVNVGGPLRIRVSRCAQLCSVAWCSC